MTYVKSIYEPSKMDIYNNPQLSQMNQGFIEDFVLLSSEITPLQLPARRLILSEIR